MAIATANPPALGVPQEPSPRRLRPARRTRSKPGADAVREWLANTTWTEEAYFGLPDWNGFVELSDGTLILPDMPTLAHQQVVQALFRELSAWNATRRAGRIVLGPYPVRLWAGKVREPDVALWLNEHADRLTQQRGGPPDLAVEVLSPSTRRTDRQSKMGEYARAGVAEYWIVDPDERWIEVHVLDGKSYRLLGHFDGSDEMRSQLLAGFTVAADTLMRDVG